MKVTITPKASRDLDEWIGRIAENNPLAAEAFQNRIRQCIEVIRNHPGAGRRHPKRRTIRKLVEDPIVISRFCDFGIQPGTQDQFAIASLRQREGQIH